MNNSHLIATLDLVQEESLVIPEFNKKRRWIGRISTLERLFQSLVILMNEEDEVLEEIVEAFGK